MRTFGCHWPQSVASNISHASFTDVIIGGSPIDHKI
jgi:hypothetical protein